MENDESRVMAEIRRCRREAYEALSKLSVSERQARSRRRAAELGLPILPESEMVLPREAPPVRRAG